MTSNAESSSHSAQALRAVVKPLGGDSIDFDRLVDAARHARLVLIGEASHGTHEFYRVRAEITKRLIREHGFIGVAAEADWPDAYRVNRYVRGRGTDRDAGEALGDFRRFPQWMWRNADVLDFVGWLREHNEHVRPADRVGFYGLDLYSLHASIEAVLRYLQRVDPKAAERAKQRYACFDRFGTDPQTYGYATRFDLTPTCEHEVVSQLVELRRAAGEYATRDGLIAPDDLFFAQQNARVVRNAERYYRSMFGSHVESWNLRDSHMHETLDTLRGFLEEQRQGARIVVWAHNSHLGDARETEMGSHGELNLGQLVRQQYGREVLLVGFSTYVGTVTAASDWGEPAERRTVRLALPGSYEALFHEFGFGNCFADLRTVDEGLPSVRHSHLERAIGVIYHPETERQSHYFRAILSRQFDAILHYDSTRAVEPLERTSSWERGEPPETYPSAL